MTKTTATHLGDHSPQERPLWLQIVLVSSIASIAMISMLPFLGIAKLLGVDMSKLSGVQFQFQPVPVLFFFGYGATVVLVIALAQKYLHHRSLKDLGFRPGFLLPIIAERFLELQSRRYGWQCYCFPSTNTRFLT